MKPCLKLIVIALLSGPFVAFEVSAVAGQTVSPEPSAGVDALCDYCKDYTDAAAAAGSQRSAYRPGTGYAAEPENEVAAAELRRQEVAKLRIRQSPPTTEGSPEQHR
jgi:hypothetical protein